MLSFIPMFFILLDSIQIYSTIIMQRCLLDLIQDWEENIAISFLGFLLIVFNAYTIAEASPETTLSLGEFPQHQRPHHPSQVNLPEQSFGYFSGTNDNLPPPQHTPYLPHIYSNQPPPMFSPDLPPPPPTPQEKQDQNHSYQNGPPIRTSSKRTLQRGHRFGDV